MSRRVKEEFVAALAEALGVSCDFGGEITPAMIAAGREAITTTITVNGTMGIYGNSIGFFISSGASKRFF